MRYEFKIIGSAPKEHTVSEMSIVRSKLDDLLLELGFIVWKNECTELLEE